MLYCKPCQEENKWPFGAIVSYGTCESCGRVAHCMDTPSWQLPILEQFAAPAPLPALTESQLIEMLKSPEVREAIGRIAVEAVSESIERGGDVARATRELTTERAHWPLPAAIARLAEESVAARIERGGDYANRFK